MCIHTNIDMCIFTCIYIYMHAYISICIYTVYVYTHTHMNLLYTYESIPFMYREDGM